MLPPQPRWPGGAGVRLRRAGGCLGPRWRPPPAAAILLPMTTPTLAPRTLGHSDIEVSGLCLGGSVFGWTVDEPASYDILDAFLERGGTFVDTADIYATWVDPRGGTSEEIIGRWLATRGHGAGDVVVATKVGMEMPEGTGLAPGYVIAAAERSRARLGVETIDLLYAHRPDPSTPIVDTVRAFDELVRAGTIRSFGLSNVDARQLQEALDACDEHGYAAPVAIQNEYNLVDRAGWDGELRELCLRRDVVGAPYYALAAGFLTGKYRADAPLPDSPRARGVLERYGHEDGWRLLAAIDQVAARLGATPAQVAIAWLARQPGIAAPIASGTSPEHVRELLGALELELTADDLALLG